MSILNNKWFKYATAGKSGFFLAIMLISLAGSSYLGFWIPRLMLELPQAYQSVDQFNSMLFKLGVFFVLIYFNKLIYNLSIAQYVRVIILKVRSHCYEKWLLKYELIGRNKAKKDEFPLGEVISRIMNDVESFRELITSGTFGIFIDLFFVASALISFISLSWKMGTFLSGMEVIAVLLLIWGSKYMRVVFLSVRESRGKVSRALADVVGGVQETYYLDHGDYVSKRGKVVLDDFLFKQLKSNVWDASYYSLAESLYPIFLSMVVLFFPYSGIAQAMIIFSIVDLIQRSINPIKSISGKMANVQRALSGFQRIKEFLDHLNDGDSSSMDDDRKLIDFTEMRVEVEKFSYQKGDFELRDIQFLARRGELTGIVGMSGCGKSTLLNILSGQIIPKKGAVSLFDNQQLQLNFPNEERVLESFYRQHVGLVSQDSHIFSKSFKFNISLGKGSDEEFAQFWSDMSKRTPYLVDWGVEPEDLVEPKDLSLGQRQLLAAWRSLYLRKKIVLFDEISSGLDSKLEFSLREAMMNSLNQSLTFVVAHRIETVMKADNILVMDEGRLSGQGSHSSLMGSNQSYQNFIDEISHSPRS